MRACVYATSNIRDFLEVIDQPTTKRKRSTLTQHGWRTAQRDSPCRSHAARDMCHEEGLLFRYSNLLVTIRSDLHAATARSDLLAVISLARVRRGGQWPSTRDACEPWGNHDGSLTGGALNATCGRPGGERAVARHGAEHERRKRKERRDSS